MNWLVCIIALLWSSHVSASPSKAVVDTCLRTADVHPKVHYQSWPVREINEFDNEERKRNELTMRFRGQSVGIWTSERQRWGIILNGQSVPSQRIISLAKKSEPYEFDPRLAMLGEIRDGKNKYVCVTFNFDGIGRSGSYQNVRGAYLIEAAPELRVYYAAGNIALHAK